MRINENQFQTYSRISKNHQELVFRLIWESIPDLFENHWELARIIENQWESSRINRNWWESVFRLIQELTRINSRLIWELVRITENHWELVRIIENHQELVRINFRLIQESVKIIKNQFHSYLRISENWQESSRIGKNHWESMRIIKNHIKIRSFLFDGPRPNDTDIWKSMYL